MSLQLLRSVIGELPYALRDQVIGYAESVRDAIPQISEDLSVSLSTDAKTALVFLAGVRKLHAICAASFWSLDNTAHILGRSGIDGITLAGVQYGAGSPAHQTLKRLLTELEDAIGQADADNVRALPFKEFCAWVADEFE